MFCVTLSWGWGGAVGCGSPVPGVVLPGQPGRPSRTTTTSLASRCGDGPLGFATPPSGGCAFFREELARGVSGVTLRDLDGFHLARHVNCDACATRSSRATRSLRPAIATRRDEGGTRRSRLRAE